jgi:predicted membrane channel-forming protein YqfA (hemolysin III family)
MFESRRLDGIIAAMFESLLPPAPEPMKAWLFTTLYGLWCVVAVSGVVISFWKHRTFGPLSLVCYAAVFVLTLYFFVEARNRRPTQKDVCTRCFILFVLGYLPTFVHWTFM